jgi:hypothetical protein
LAGAGGYEDFRYPATYGAAVPDYSGGMAQFDPEKISYKTNSTDPILMAGRVFVGNLNTQIIGREKLLKMYMRYGKILGCTVFKGYAFIQFSTPEEAHASIQATNSMLIANQNLDVKLACENAKPDGGKMLFAGPPPKRALKHLTPTPTPTPPAPRKAPVKRPAPLITDETPSTELLSYESTDTLVCGNCEKVFHDWIQFRDHRRKPCNTVIATPKIKRPEDEPESVKCFVCKEEFGFCWELLKHLGSLHHLIVYVDEQNPDQNAENNIEDFMKNQMTTG